MRWVEPARQTHNAGERSKDVLADTIKERSTRAFRRSQIMFIFIADSVI